jgi:hypothetical protein
VPHDDAEDRRRYVHELLRLYVATPGVAGHVRRADRDFAGTLFDRRIPLYVVETAFVVAAARRVRNNAFASPMPPIRSVHYFAGVIQEVLDRPLGYRELDELRRVVGRGQPPL